ncbi:MAG TPA: hypothetical protein VN952_11225 [Chthoniobacterales bacterium]|nr:hypothetical protein [Chthoniobacterales bacterium]
MKSTLRMKSAWIAFVVGIILGMLVPIARLRAQAPFGTPPVRTTLFGTVQAPAPNDCEQFYRLAIGGQGRPEVASEYALLYLACKEHSR